MVVAILLVLVLMWILLFSPFAILTGLPAIAIGGLVISLTDVIIFLLILWLVGLLPSPFRQIGGIILVFWVLSALGFFAAFPGLSSIILLIVIVWAIAYLIGGRFRY